MISMVRTGGGAHTPVCAELGGGDAVPAAAVPEMLICGGSSLGTAQLAVGVACSLARGDGPTPPTVDEDI